MDHTRLVHENCQIPYCMFCEGGLFACTTCGGMEGSLTTDCCGRRLTQQEEYSIYTVGNLDFRDGKWVNKPNFIRGWMWDRMVKRADIIYLAIK